jgi:hypothetical protein
MWKVVLGSVLLLSHPIWAQPEAAAPASPTPAEPELTLPINLSISKITRFGPFPMSVGVGAGYYVEHPDIGPEWKLRTIFTLILPRSK